jgi:hypothetical protein
MMNLIGGEMLVRSDLDATGGPPPAGGPALRGLLGAVAGRTLVAGPHAPALIDEIDAADLTLLVRGVADAEALAARYAARPGVTICCGSLEKLAATPAYDTVLALDGLDRLASADAAETSWDETLARLLSVLQPQGRLLLAVENLFGLHRLLTLPTDLSDTDWSPPDDRDPARPRTLPALRTRLAEAGVPVLRAYAAYPSVSGPDVLFGEGVLTDPALEGYLTATLTAAGVGAPPLLADPGRLIGGALRHGLAAALAPGWIVRAGGGPAGPPGLVRGQAVDRDASGRWQAGGPVPLGRTLADLLLAAGQRRALPAVRELLCAWQGGAAAGVPADRIVVDADGGFHALAPAGDPVRALRGFAALAIAGGYAHLWPVPADEAELTALLAGMTGRELAPADVPMGEPQPEALRELVMARDRLRHELAGARARHEFYERTIAERDAELKRVRLLNAALTATAPGAAALRGLKAARDGYRRLRRR